MKPNPYRLLLGGVGGGGILLGVLLVALGTGLGLDGENLVSFGLIICVIGLVTFVGWMVLTGLEWAVDERARRAKLDKPSQ